MPEAYESDVQRNPEKVIHELLMGYPLASVRIDTEAILAEALAEGAPEFRPHHCWRMIFIYPHKDFPNEPGEARCQGCGRSWRLEEEYRP